jgi:hypothetical protein
LYENDLTSTDQVFYSKVMKNIDLLNGV